MKIEGCWGLMSDSETFLAPWKEQGRYLAGWQVPRETEPFSDWKVWTLPASAWLRIQLRLDQYDEAFSFMTQEFFPNNPWVANGACHEFYPNDFCNPKTDLLYCCVPIAPNPG